VIESRHISRCGVSSSTELSKTIWRKIRTRSHGPVSAGTVPFETRDKLAVSRKLLLCPRAEDVRRI
jgi:hypothetical protein